MPTGIEWTDETWNPLRGCTRVSEGCRNCYAEKIAARFSGPGLPYHGLARRTSSGEARWTGMIRLVEDALTQPLHWRRPRRVFVNSMSDLFHDGVPDSFIVRVCAVMALARQHTFQVLTKRPERMRRLLSDSQFRGDVERAAIEMGYPRAVWWDVEMTWPLPNVWLGVSVEDQRAADTRIPLLLSTPTARRFLSCEPLLGALNLTDLSVNGDRVDALRGDVIDRTSGCIADDVAAIDWVIVGGESGQGARPMHLTWARSLRDQCAVAGTPFFFKQWGDWACEPINYDRPQRLREWKTTQHLNLAGGQGFHGDEVQFATRVGRRSAGRLLDGREWSEFPQVGQPAELAHA